MCLLRGDEEKRKAKTDESALMSGRAKPEIVLAGAQLQNPLKRCMKLDQCEENAKDTRPRISKKRVLTLTDDDPPTQ